MSPTATASAPAVAPAYPAFFRVNGVAVISVVALLDCLFPDGWSGGDPDARWSAIEKWLNASRAHYYSWSGATSLRLTQQAKAVERAIVHGKRIVVVEHLS